MNEGVNNFFLKNIQLLFGYEVHVNGKFKVALTFDAFCCFVEPVSAVFPLRNIWFINIYIYNFLEHTCVNVL